MLQTKSPLPREKTEKQQTAMHSKRIYQSVKPVVRLKKHKTLAVNSQLNVKKEKQKTYQQAPWTAGNKKLIYLDRMSL